MSSERYLKQLDREIQSLQEKKVEKEAEFETKIGLIKEDIKRLTKAKALFLPDKDAPAKQ